MKLQRINGVWVATYKNQTLYPSTTDIRKAIEFVLGTQSLYGYNR